MCASKEEKGSLSDCHTIKCCKSVFGWIPFFTIQAFIQMTVGIAHVKRYLFVAQAICGFHCFKICVMFTTLWAVTCIVFQILVLLRLASAVSQ